MSKAQKSQQASLVMLGVIVGITLMLAMVILGHTSTANAEGKVDRPPLPSFTHKMCVQEGDVNCWWNAQHEGNGIGHSYFVRQFPGEAHMVCVMYSQPSFAKHNDYCIAENPPHHRPGMKRTHKVCPNVHATNCFYPRHGQRRAFYSVTVPLRDTGGNDDLGDVDCHFFVKVKRPDSCVATGLFGRTS